MRSLLHPCPPSGDAGANQLHLLLRRSRWDRQCADSPLFLRSRNCKQCLDLDEFHSHHSTQLGSAGSAYRRFLIHTGFRSIHFAAGSQGVSGLKRIDQRQGAIQGGKRHCGKAGRNCSLSATHSFQAGQRAQGSNKELTERKPRSKFSSQLHCSSRIANQPQQPPIQALLKI